MTDAELIAWLRELSSFENGVGVMQDFYCGEEMLAAADRIEALIAERDEAEAKLAKAVEALEMIVVDNTWGLDHKTYMKCRKALAEIKGESHE